MNIWYISKYASPQTRHFYLADQWSQMGHKVCVFTSSNHLKYGVQKKFSNSSYIERGDGSFIKYWLKTYASRRDGGIERIKSWLHFEWLLIRAEKKSIFKPNVIIVSSLSLLTVINGYRLSKKYNAKFIFEVRDIWPLSAMVLGGYGKYNPFMFILSRIEKFGYKRADAIVGTMPNLTEHVTNIIGKQEKTYCIPQGLDTEFYANSVNLEQEYINNYIPEEKFIVAYTGSLNANNPLDTLLKAAEKLSFEENIHFLIVGNGYEKKNLMKKAKKLKNVSFPPTVRKEQVYHLLSYTSVCFDAFESILARYGLSRNKWIDYMYAAKPIICSYSGYKSMINDACSGSFVPFDEEQELSDAILKYYYMDKNDLNAEGKRGREFLLKNRTFDKLAEEYLKII